MVEGGRSRTTRTDLRRARPPPACRTPHSPRTTRWESPVGGESPPSGARTPADQAPPEGRCSTGSHSDEPVANEKRTARCAWPARHTPHSLARQPPRSSDRRSAPADGQRHQVRHHGPPRLVRAPPLSEPPHPRRLGPPGLRRIQLRRSIGASGSMARIARRVATCGEPLDRRQVWVLDVAMDAITMLKQDHQAVERLFKRFEKAGDRGSPRSGSSLTRSSRPCRGTPRSKSRFSIP